MFWAKLKNESNPFGTLLIATWRGDTSYSWELRFDGSKWSALALPGLVLVKAPVYVSNLPLGNALEQSLKPWADRIFDDMKSGRAYVTALETLRQSLFEQLNPADEQTFFSSDELEKIQLKIDDLIQSLDAATKSNQQLNERVSELEKGIAVIRDSLVNMPKNTAIRAVFSKLGRGLAKLWESKEIRELAVEKLKQIGNSGIGP